MFNTKTITTGNNVQYLVILIPDDGHHGKGEEGKAVFLDQHFVPDNAIINTGTTVLLCNGDASHERTIDVKNSNDDSVFNIDEITYSQPSESLSLVTIEYLIMKQKVILV